jgi:hypothetical protein
MAAIPAATPSIKPQETLPVKKPIPREIIAKAANALPPLPVAISRTLHNVLANGLLSAEVVLAICADALLNLVSSMLGDTRRRMVRIKRIDIFLIIEMNMVVFNLLVMFLGKFFKNC